MNYGRVSIDWKRQPLGQVPDTFIAALLECTPQAVKYARDRRLIPPFCPPGGASKKGTGNDGRRRIMRREAQQRRRKKQARGILFSCTILKNWPLKSIRRAPK